MDSKSLPLPFTDSPIPTPTDSPTPHHHIPARTETLIDSLHPPPTRPQPRPPDSLFCLDDELCIDSLPPPLVPSSSPPPLSLTSSRCSSASLDSDCTVLDLDEFELQLQTQLTEAKRDFETALEMKDKEICSLTEQLASEKAERLSVENQLRASMQLADKISTDLKHANELLSSREVESLDLTNHIRALEKTIEQAREERLRLSNACLPCQTPLL